MPNEGHKSWGSIVEESVYGTSPGAGESYFEFVSEDMKDETPIVPSKSLRGVTHRNVFQGNRIVGGSALTLEALFEGCGLFLKGAMGGYAFQADTPAAGANTHTFTLADTLPSYALEISKADVPTGKTFLYEGCKMNTLVMGIEEENPLSLVMGIIAQKETPNTTASGTPTYPDWLPILSRFTGTLTLAGTASLVYKSGTINLDNKLARRFLLSQLTKEPKRDGKRMVTGTAILEFDDLNLYDKYKAGTPGSLGVVFTSDTLITGTTYYTMTISMPNIYLTGRTPTVNSEGVVEAPFDFHSIYGTSSDALSIIIVNTEATLA